MNNVNCDRRKAFTDKQRLYEISEKPPLRTLSQAAKNTLYLINKKISVSKFELGLSKNPSFKIESGDLSFSPHLFRAISCDNIKIALYILNKIPSKYLNSPDIYGYTPLHYAISLRSHHYGRLGNTPPIRTLNNLKIIQALLNKGADVNLTISNTSIDFRNDRFNQSPLTLALQIKDLDSLHMKRNIERSDIDLVKTLLFSGAEKLYAISNNKLIEQKFSESEDEIYQIAKKEIKQVGITFIAFCQVKSDVLLPKEIIAHILTFTRVINPSQNYQKSLKEKILFFKSKYEIIT